MGAYGNTAKRRGRSISRNRMKVRRVKKTARGKVGRIQGEISHPELVTPGILKKRMKNPRTNVTISGKKKNKILKQIRHMQREKSQMQVEDPQPIITKKKGVPKDIEMAEVKQKKQKKTVRKNQMDVDEET